MSRIKEEIIYEENSLLKKAMEKVLYSIESKAGDVLFVNMSYSESQENHSPYSGMQYVVNLRSAAKDISPVLFYGFEEIGQLKNKPEASILNSPAIKYIKMPFKIDQLKEILSKLSPVNKREKLLNKETKKLLAEEKYKEFQSQVRGFVHDWRNGVTYLTALLNKLREHQTDSKAVQESMDELIRYKVDFISKKCASYNAMREAVEQKFKKCKKINALPKHMQISEKSYSSMYINLEKVLKGKGSVRALLSALQKTINNLKEVENLLDECTKR